MRRTPIRRISKKKARELAEYTKLRNEFMRTRPICEVCHKSKATECHHTEGRGKNYLRVETFLATCHRCHMAIHDRPGKARALGLLK